MKITTIIGLNDFFNRFVFSAAFVRICMVDHVCLSYAIGIHQRNYSMNNKKPTTLKLPLVNIHQCLVPAHEGEIPLTPACENKKFQYSCKAKKTSHKT